MDNDDVRRGKPTSHKVYGEAVAILAGDGLLTEAFRVMSNVRLSRGIPAGSLLTVIRLVAEASGYEGMVAGQVTDIQSEGAAVEAPVVEFIHTHKTGALIAASVTSGAILGGGTAAQVRSIRRYGESIGLAFQIADDILDVEGDSEKMGKGVGGDARKKKVTYPAVFGLARSKEIERELADRAIHSLKRFDHKADPLREIATYIVVRRK
jgi:geranylgeranyl diphosphate synthase type II